MAFDIQGGSDSQLDAQLDLFLQQIIEQEDLCDSPLEVSSARPINDPWSSFVQQQALLPPSITRTEGVPLLNNLPAPSTALPQAVSASSQLTPQSLDLCCIPVACSRGMETAPPVLQLAAPLHSQATPAAFQAPIYNLLQPPTSVDVLDQAASAGIETQPAPHQLQAVIQPPAIPSGTKLHTTTTNAAGGANKRSIAWSEKNRRAQQRFRDRQKACISLSATCCQS